MGETLGTDSRSRTNARAIVASFLFTDLVAFSKGTAVEQFDEKASLAAILRRALSPLAENDYWLKDTGDGAVIAFVSSPEHALYVALAIRRDYENAAATTHLASKNLRTGLHVGTVKLSVDIEGRPDFVGDGINATKRVMDFADPGQITASRSFFEAIANLDAAYAAIFQHLGASDDKHGRAHDLYAVTPSDEVLDKFSNELAIETPGHAESMGQPVAAQSIEPTAASALLTETGRREWAMAGVAILLIAAASSMLVTKYVTEPVATG